MVKPEILIISNRYDFACDYICACLHEENSNYLRLNTDDLLHLHVFMNPINGEIEIKIDDQLYKIDTDSLKSILYRGPTYLRETSVLNLSPEDKLSKSQWTAFIRTLMVFDKCRWMNHPHATYFAETKAVQLKIAHQVGFQVPNTIITNSDLWHEKITPNSANEVIVKGIDTIYLGIGEKLAFGYTNVVERSNLSYETMSIAPVFLQQYLDPKVDLRVTVVDKEVFSVEILVDRQGVSGDWRLKKDSVEYVPIDLPIDIKTKCIELVSKLGLSYGAIDLARVNETYYFIEINPTGEWAWLVDQSNLRIDFAIAQFLNRGV
ncbi:hypothetical protein [Paenibacillus agaridevorans]|uniref:hypothetical protein n=1 Tax=Paenibacillus agaridevorans TaxID=171404 RepID=UPI001BE466CE|nr:hypothetical protein [Paenibacillus agaridevorans]